MSNFPIFILQRLKSLKEDCGGGLFGVMYSKNLIIMGFDNESPDKLDFKKMQDNFPTELDLCGIFKFGDCSDAEAHMEEILTNVDITDNPILLQCEESETGMNVIASQWKNGKLEKIDFEIYSEEQIYRQFTIVRLLGYNEITIDCDVESIQNSFTNLRIKQAYGNVLFQLQNHKIYFDSTNIIGMNEDSKISDLVDLSRKKDDDKKSKKEAIPTDFQVINIDCLMKRSVDTDKTLSALNFTLEKNKIIVPITVDAIAVLHISTNTLALYDILVESLCRTLRLIEENMIEQLQQGSEFTIPESFHFKPDHFGHFYTCIYPHAIPDNDDFLTSKRRELHQQFSLPLTKPIFRRANNYQFDLARSSLLVNPHIGLKSTVVDGKQSLVAGKYTYHHYMQDKFNDDGWGCAYRSLQTLCSWFRFQGYSNHRIPSHEDIQRYLVKIGDKPKNFVNSRQWIGSTEVSMCLNGFMDVDSRIMHVASGSQLAAKGSELAYHFETEGTPVMIGGGVFAHTILGVDFNSNTGELKFLILDPHFTGADELQVVQSKGWCGWKGTNFWDKNSYYNLCMPQRPKIF